MYGVSGLGRRGGALCAAEGQWNGYLMMFAGQLPSESWSKCHDIQTISAKEWHIPIHLCAIVPVARTVARDYFRSAGREARVEQAFDLSSEGRDEALVAEIEDLMLELKE